jgi:hypothetical protein
MRWQESSIGISTADNIDEAEGVIRDVKIIGPKSKNRGRTYKESTLRKAMPLYEGAQVYVDHDRKNSERSLKDGWGVIRNVSMREGSLFADLHYLKSHPATTYLIERARRFPEKFGLSHDASGDKTIENGVEVVESIDKVHSVDIVADPATNKSLFESKGNTVEKTVKQIVEQHEKQVAFAKVLREMCDPKMMEEAGFDASAVPVELQEEAGATPEDEVRAAFRSIVMAVVDDESLSIEEVVKRIKIVLKAKEQIKGAIGTDDSSSDEMVSEEMVPDEMSNEDVNSYDEEEMMSEATQKIIAENKKLREQVEANELLRECESMLKESKVEPTDIRLKALMALPADDRKALVEQFAAKASVKTRPATSQSILRESEDVNSRSVEDWAKRILS